MVVVPIARVGEDPLNSSSYHSPPARFTDGNFWHIACSGSLLECRSTGVLVLNRLLKNSLGVLRRAQDERRGFDIIDDFPSMLRLSKHSEPFSTACLSLLYEQSKTKV